MIDPASHHHETQQPNVAAIAVIGLFTGIVLWLGGACLVLGSGADEPPGAGGAGGNVSTPVAARATPTRVPDRTSCTEIAGTEYRSETERQWFLANCR